jgi:hypothetical protein
LLLKKALTGANGDNETYVGNSKQLSLTFYDENKNEIPINNAKSKFEFVIPKDLSASRTSIGYEYVNASNMDLADKNHFLPNAINTTVANISFHLQIKPIERNTSYVVLMKLGQTPVLNSTMQSYDYWEIFHPKGKNLKKNKQIYNLVIYIHKNNRFKRRE